MVGGVEASVDFGVVADAIDLYVHANPDLIQRLSGDFELAREFQAAGLAAAVHRHHYTSTAERGQVVRDEIGFDLLGAILLNEPVGGLNPSAVELALRMGAVWVGFPSIGAGAYRARLHELPERSRPIVGFGRYDILLVDEQGRLLPAVHDVLELIAESGVAMGLGYSSFA